MSQMPTNVATPSMADAMRRRGATSSTVGRLSSSDSIDPGAFAPGTMLAERYRIVGLIGKGGMGVVYRADDLKLGQPVALKFLPPEFAEDPVRRERFFAEVRIARQVSHPNVCRVHDVGEIDGQHYLSMEYVDGEDLASLLRRIGRLPNDKALEIARQLCVGVAAAHERGVLHRDLKPSNVMLDGRGRARITDFGLAAAVGEIVEGEVAGTPAYMAPEQLAGQAATIRSDLYALGLVLYELWTGKRAFTGSSLEELKKKRESGPPPEMKDSARDVDPAVDRIVLRCLESDSNKRPASALQIAAALPGGDPLAAALAAGETPSPETVAAAGGEGALEPGRAWTILGGIFAAVVGVGLLAPAGTDFGLAPLPKSTEILEDRARQIAARFGSTAATDSVVGWRQDEDQVKELGRRRPSTRARQELGESRPHPWRFWYRSSPRPLVPLDQTNGSEVSRDDPPLEVSGMILVEVDARGSLTSFRAVPPQVDEARAASPEPDWRPLLSEAGLDPSRLTPSVPQWVPPTAFDARAEWNGSFDGQSGTPIHVVAAMFHGRPVYFELLGPWSKPERMAPKPIAATERLSIGAAMLAFLFLLVACAILARRNVRLQRGDRRGAWTLAMIVIGLPLVAWLFDVHHVAEFLGEFNLWISALTGAVFSAAWAWLMYMALEPYVRRRAPELLISWGRVVEGRLRDALVGRDVLSGLGIGVLLALWSILEVALPTWFDIPGVAPEPGSRSLLLGVSPVVSLIARGAYVSIIRALTILSLFSLAQILFRRRWLSYVFAGILPLLFSLGDENPRLALPYALVTVALIVFVLVKRGLVGLVSAWFAWSLLLYVQPTFDFSRWYSGRSWFCMLVLLALAVWAFFTSLGKRSPFGTMRLGDA